jgi:UTP:GlnB (protein PII) uridylyltransferase
MNEVGMIEPEVFLRSMPSAYGSVFDAEAVKQHAGIVFRRGSASVHVELWRTLPDLGIQCVVARDAPGLLSLVAATLAQEGLSIDAAQVYTRRRQDGEDEAVDFFWVRRVRSGPPEPQDVLQLAVALKQRFGD